jgi:hypothetical protein
LILHLMSSILPKTVKFKVELFSNLQLLSPNPHKTMTSTQGMMGFSAIIWASPHETIW